MRTAFLHEEEHEQCLRARHALAARFRESESDDAAVVEVVEFALNEKSYRDGLLARWTSDDLRWLLLDAAPSRMVPLSRLSDVPDAVHRWIAFLHRHQLLMTAQTYDELGATITSATPGFLRSMADPQQWDFSKLDELTGINPSIDRIRQEWGDAAVERTLHRAYTERPKKDAVWLPPMRVRDASASLSEGAGTDVVGETCELIRSVGAGRDLGSDDSELVLAWATQAHLVHVADGRVRATALGRTLREEPRALWACLWKAFPLAMQAATPEGEMPRTPHVVDPPTDSEIVDSVLTGVLRLTYSTPDPIPFELLVDTVHANLHEAAGIDVGSGPSSLRVQVHEFLHRIAEALVKLGVMRSFHTSDRQQVERIRRAFPAGHEPDLTMLELMPLGVWAAREWLLAAGFLAPTVDEVAELPAEVMVMTVPRSPDDTVEDVIETWIERRRDQDSACGELTSLLTGIDDPLVRMVTLHVLERTGRAGVDAALAVREDPVAGAAVRLWLQGRPGAGKVALRKDDELKMSLDGMALSAFADVPGLLALFSQWSEQQRGQVIEQVRDSGHSGAESILKALAVNHTDAATSRAAERALSSVR